MSRTEDAPSRLLTIALDQLNAEARSRALAIIAAAREVEARDSSWQFDLGTLRWYRETPNGDGP